MYPIVNAFWELLKGNITYKDKTIPIVKRLKSKDKTPCITLDIASDMQINRDYRTDKTQRIVLEHSAEIWVNIWCDTEEERHTILSQIRLLFFKALGNHYTTCSHYNDGTCNFLDRECEALTVMNGRSAKSQCPHPKRNDYTSWFKKHHIIKRSFRLSGISEMDELDVAEPVLRTLIKFDLNYIMSHDLGGIVATDLTIEEDLR